MPYEWAGPGVLKRIGEKIHPGEEFEPTEAELDTFSDRIKESESDETESDNSESDQAASEPNYSEMDYEELRSLAVEADTDEINGRSKKDEIIAYFEE